MSDLFEATRRESAVDIVVNSIKQLLMERRLKPGDKLPSELEICDGLNVSRGSVREAMKILSAFGLIEIKVGNGTYVCEKPGSNIFDSLLFSFFAANPDIEDLFEFREHFETIILELVIDHYDDNVSERKELEKNIKDLETLMQKDGSCDAFFANDIEFHQILGRATHNLLTQSIYSFVIEFMYASIKATHQLQKGQFSHDVHKHIVEVIRKKEYSKIKETVSASVKTWYDLGSRIENK